MLSDGFNNISNAMSTIGTNITQSAGQAVGGLIGGSGGSTSGAESMNHQMGGMAIPIDPYGDSIIEKMFNAMSSAFYTHLKEQATHNPDHNYFDSGV
jgi:hypothetical protein